jgi:fatty-acyl-CoA synthase
MKKLSRCAVPGAVYQTELTPLSYLRRSAEVCPDKTAIVYGERRYTYTEFAEATVNGL